MCIIEPRCRDDVAGWKSRELMKLEKGVSGYCDPDLYAYIEPLELPLYNYIKRLHSGLF